MLPGVQMLSDKSRRSKLDCVALAIIKGKAVALKTLFPCYGKRGGRIQPAA